MNQTQSGNQGPSLVITPTVKTFGIRYLRSGPGWLEAEFEPDGRFSNNFGLVQGGVLGVFLDNIMGQCSYTLLEPEQSLTTTGLNIQFLEPAQLGLIKGTARVVKKGSRLVFAEGELQDAGGKVLARATASLLVLKRPRRKATVPPA